MALVSGRGSRLNPNAAPFIPAVYRQVEDFSSEWWNLVQNSASFHDYWVRQREHQEASCKGFSDTKDDDITNLLPDTFDVGYDEFPYAEADFEEFESSLRAEMKAQNSLGVGLNAGSLIKNIDLHSSSPKGRGTGYLVDQSKYNERPVQLMSFNHGLRRIHQPR